MGFHSRLRHAKDSTRPLGERGQALCSALTYSHLGGYGETLTLIGRRFGVVIGEPVIPEAIDAAVAFLELERNEWLRWRDTTIRMHRRMRQLGLPADAYRLRR